MRAVGVASGRARPASVNVHFVGAGRCAAVDISVEVNRSTKVATSVNIEQRPTEWITDWEHREASEPVTRTWVKSVPTATFADPWLLSEATAPVATGGLIGATRQIWTRDFQLVARARFLLSSSAPPDR